MKPLARSRSRALAFLCASLLVSSLASQAGIPASALPVAGTNMSVNKAQSVAVYWNDVIHSVDTWSSTTPATMPVDANGWPTDLQGSTGVFLPIFLNNGFHYPTGDYVLSWTGNGDLTLVALGGTPVTLKSSAVTTSGGRKVYTVADNTAASFKVKWISTAAAPNNVRNVHLWLPGKENSPNLITDTVAADLAPFEVLRMMDWGETNGNGLINWADRPKVNGPIWDPVPYETMVGVCNELNKDLWINIPYQASDAFVTSFATYIRDNLNPGLVCWIEYSNEIWNFGNSNFAVQTNYVINTFPGANLDEKYAYRAGQIFNLFYTAFGSQASSRLMRVCASQATFTIRAQNRLAALGTNVDALAVANYFGKGSGGGNTTNSTVNQWIVDNWNNGALTFAQFRDYLIATEIDTALVPLWAQDQAYADAAGVPMISYEGGQHILDAHNLLTAAQQQFITDFQSTQEMRQAQRHALDQWRALGAKTHLVYTNYGTGTAKGGFWGHRNYSGQPLAQAPKWNAVLDWIATAPPVSITETFDSAAFPATFSTGTFVGVSNVTWNYANVKAYTQTGPAAWMRGGGLGSLSNSVSGAVKSVSLNFAARTSTNQAQLELLVGGVVVATSPLQGTAVATWTVTGLTGASGAQIKIRCKSTGEAVVDNITLGF